MGNIAFNGYVFFSTQFNGYAEEFLTNAQVKKLLDNGEALLSSTEGEEFYRIETYGDKVRNESLLNGYKDVSAYYSLIDGNVTNYYKLMELISQRSAYRIDNQDNRTILDALAGVKYFIATDKNAAPYAYELKQVKSIHSEDYYLLENLFALPLGYTYHEYMTEEEYRKLDVLERQNAMLYSVILEKPTDHAMPTAQDMGIGITKLDYKITADQDIVLGDHSIKVRKEGAAMTLTFRGETKAETYVRFANLRIDKKAMLLQTFKVKGEREPIKKVNVRNRYHNTYFGKKNYLVNNGYSKTAKSWATITFPEPMTYNYDEIEVYSLSMEHVKKQLQVLGQDTLHDIKVNNNRIEGDADLKEKGVMLLSIPYSKGWSAVVDGEKAELKKANIMYSSLELPEGTHHIVLTYRTPYLNEGLLLSASSLFVLIGVFLYHRRKETANV